MINQMNLKPIISSALVTSIIGGFLGLSLDRITQYGRGELGYENILYDNIRKEYIVIGATLGLMIGAGITEIKQEKMSRKSNFTQQNTSDDDLAE